MQKRTKPWRHLFIVAALFYALLTGGCTGNFFGAENDVYSDTLSGTEIAAQVEAQTETQIATQENTEESTEKVADEDTPKITFITSGKSAGNNLKSLKKYSVDIANEASFSLDKIPDYAGNAYVYIHDSMPFFTEEEKNNTEEFENYSELDSLGRCGVAYANLCRDLMPTEKRGPIGQVRPSGWHTVKYSELIEDNYLYNRCHLIGYQLAGENANECNLITGTRYLNVTGMLPFENAVHGYIEETDNHVLYRVTPRFLDDNLVASGVQMEAWSVEDEGEGICFHVYCYNVQPGIEIDYATGESLVAQTQNLSQTESTAQTENTAQIEDTAQSENTTQTKQSAESRQISESELNHENAANETDDTSENEVTTFVLNKNTKKFHLQSCTSVSDMAERNKKIVSGTIEEMEAAGYTPCARCIGR